MAGYFRRLAQQSGLLPGARPRPKAETADIVELHEEQVIDASAPPLPAAAQEAARSDHATPSVYDRAAATPSLGRDSSLAPAAPLGLPSVPPGAANVMARPPHRAHAGDLSVSEAPRPAGSVRFESERASVSSSSSGAVNARHGAPSAASERGANSPASVFEANAAARRAERPTASTPASSAPSRAAEMPAASQRHDDSVRPDSHVVPEMTASVASRRPTLAAAAPASRRETLVPRARENGIKVHIGNVNVEIRAPAPRPVAPPVFTAPVPSAAPAAPAEAPFSASRHYLRSSR